MVASVLVLVATVMFALPAEAAEKAHHSHKVVGLPKTFSWQFTLREDTAEMQGPAVLLGDDEEFTPRNGAALPFPVVRQEDLTPPHATEDSTVRLSTKLPLFADGGLHGGIGIANELRRLDLRETAVIASLALRL